MSNRKRSYAFFLLILFSVVAFHDLLPHVHHDHDVITDSEHHEEHHHEHDGALAVLEHALQFHHHHHHTECEIDVCPETPVVKRENRGNNHDCQAIIIRTEERTLAQSGIFVSYKVEAYHEDALLKSISGRGPPASNC